MANKTHELYHTIEHYAVPCFTSIIDFTRSTEHRRALTFWPSMEAQRQDEIAALCYNLLYSSQYYTVLYFNTLLVLYCTILYYTRVIFDFVPSLKETKLVHRPLKSPYVWTWYGGTETGWAPGVYCPMVYYTLYYTVLRYSILHFATLLNSTMLPNTLLEYTNSTGSAPVLYCCMF